MRPSELIVVAVLHVISALLNFLTIPFLIFQTAATDLVAPVTAMLVVLAGLVVAAELFLAGGLYRGRRWAWIIALISAGSSTLIDISALSAAIFSLFLRASTASAAAMMGLFVGFLISIAVFVYLLSTDVRKFFGFVNPVTEVQIRST